MKYKFMCICVEETKSMRVMLLSFKNLKKKRYKVRKNKEREKMVIKS